MIASTKHIPKLKLKYFLQNEKKNCHKDFSLVMFGCRNKQRYFFKKLQIFGGHKLSNNESIDIPIAFSISYITRNTLFLWKVFPITRFFGFVSYTDFCQKDFFQKLQL